jgi:hypothetical protein
MSPVFSWGVPGGVWVGSEADGEDSVNMFGSGRTIRIRARTPFADATVRLRPTIVYTTGTEGNYAIAISSGTNATGSAIATLPDSVSDPTMYTFDDDYTSNDLAATKDVDSEVTVNVIFDGDLDGDSWICIHSIALWPEYSSTIPA